MSNTRKTTIYILGTVIVLFILWDVWVYLEPSEGDTISEVTLGFSQRFSSVPFAVGVACGHLFWPDRSDRPWERKYTIPVLVWLFCALLTWDLVALHDTEISWIRVHPSLVFGIGFVAGRLFWAQRLKDE